MQTQRAALVGVAMASMLYPAFALAQISGGNSTGRSGSTSSQTTTGLASDQAHIPPPGTNSLGTANASDWTGNRTVGANMKPSESQRQDARIRAEDAKVDAKIKSICRGC